MTVANQPLPFLGTWKVTKCESSSPSLPNLTSGNFAFSQENDAIHYENDGVWSDGRTFKVSCILPLNGDWCAVAGSAAADSASILVIDGGFETKQRKAGTDAGMTRSTVSADGRTLTTHWELPGPGGTTVRWKTTCERT